MKILRFILFYSYSMVLNIVKRAANYFTCNALSATSRGPRLFRRQQYDVRELLWGSPSPPHRCKVDTAGFNHSTLISSQDPFRSLIFYFYNFKGTVSREKCGVFCCLRPFFDPPIKELQCLRMITDHAIALIRGSPISCAPSAPPNSRLPF